MTVIRLRNNVYQGLSSDTKPTTAATNSQFLETDTGINWEWNGSSWANLPIDGIQQYANYTIYISGGNVKAKNWSTGTVTSNTDASTTIKSVISALSNGGIIAFMPGTYTIQSPLTGWANFRTYQLRGMWDNSRNGGVQLSVGTSFPNNGYIFDTSANTVASGTRNILHISDFEFYNINTGTVPNAGAILYETDVADLTSNFAFRNIYMQYMWRGIHLKGAAWYGVIDNIMYSSASDTFVGNAALIMEQGGHSDVPKSNYITHFRASGTVNSQLDNYILLKDAGYNVFVDTYSDGFKYTEAPVSLKGGTNDNHFYGLRLLDLNVSTGTNVGAVLFDGSGGTSNAVACGGNRIHNGRLGNYPFMIAYRNNAQRTHCEIAWFGGNPTIDDSGAGTNNVVVIQEGPVGSGTVDTRITSSKGAVRIVDNRPSGFGDMMGLPSTFRVYGVRYAMGGDNGINGTGVNQGFGLFGQGNIVVGNGTGASTGGIGVDTSTDGLRILWSTGTNNTFARAGWWGSQLNIYRQQNPTFTVRFRLGQVQSSSQGILYIGFINSSAQPAAGTSVLNTLLDTKIGVLFGFRSSDTTFMIMSNNAQGTATYTTAGTPNSSATDTSVHTLAITLNDLVPAIQWSYDGVRMSDITDTTNSVPPSTNVVYPIAILEAQTATSLNWSERFSILSVDLK